MNKVIQARPAVADPAPVTHYRACSDCGAPLEDLDQFCPSCGRDGRRPITAEVVAERTHIHCEQCGADIALVLDQRSYRCPFCDSTMVMESSPTGTGRQEPEFVIGFAVTPSQAEEAFRRWLGTGGFFRPSDLSQSQLVERLRGVYLPFWSFSMQANSYWSASIGEHWYRTETYTTIENGKTVTHTRTVTETEWWPLSGGHHDYHHGYLVSGSVGLSQGDAEAIMPFHLAGLKRYAPSFLAGWLNEEYSVQRAQALALSQEVFRQREAQSIAAFLPGDAQRALSTNTEYSQIHSDLILLPVYVASYRYRDQVFRFLLNGQTGRISGNKPLSATRIVIVVLLALTLIGAFAGLAYYFQNR